jgi:hypothetical protein
LADQALIQVVQLLLEIAHLRRPTPERKPSIGLGGLGCAGSRCGIGFI